MTTKPTYDMTAVNRRNYQNPDFVRQYFSNVLRPAEVSIFVKYRDNFVGRRVLDIGCGAGRVTRYIGRWTTHAVGVDFSEPMIDYCKNALPHILFYQCDVRDLSRFAEGAFDAVVFSFNGIDTLAHDDRLSAIAGIRRLLNPGGVLALSTHNRRYRRAGWGPRLQISFNPATMWLRTVHYVRSVINRSSRKRLERHEDEYSVLNDMAHDYCMLHYYIDREKQKAQLEQCGLEFLECYGEDGELLEPGDDDSESAELYYVARRV